MKELFTLGNIYVSDFILEGEVPSRGKADLQLILDEDGAVRLSYLPALDYMFGKYWYRSGTNRSMKQGLKDVVDSILSCVKLDKDLWIDIGCNDGTLFNYVPKDVIKVGIDPVEDSFKNEVERVSDCFIQDYFKAETFKKSKFGHLRAKVVTSIAMFYDIKEREQFLSDIRDVMDDSGLWVLQQSYTPLMLKQVAFDNICHEHYYYYSFFNIKKLLERNGFKIVDCQLNDINGGSFRLYVMKKEGDERCFSSQPHRDVCNFRMQSILTYEESLKLDSIETWMNFYNEIEKLKNNTVSFILDEKLKGKAIWAYGASTKGNTLLQYFGLDNAVIDAIADRSPYKWGLTTVGSNIPICSERDMREANPDYLLILPWHFITEFMERETEYIKNGGKFIVPCPKLQIL